MSVDHVASLDADAGSRTRCFTASGVGLWNVCPFRRVSAGPIACHHDEGLTTSDLRTPRIAPNTSHERSDVARTLDEVIHPFNQFDDMSGGVSPLRATTSMRVVLETAGSRPTTNGAAPTKGMAALPDVKAVRTGHESNATARSPPAPTLQFSKTDECPLWNRFPTRLDGNCHPVWCRDLGYSGWLYGRHIDIVIVESENLYRRETERNRVTASTRRRNDADDKTFVGRMCRITRLTGLCKEESPWSVVSTATATFETDGTGGTMIQREHKWEGETLTEALDLKTDPTRPCYLLVDEGERDGELGHNVQYNWTHEFPLFYSTTRPLFSDVIEVDPDCLPPSGRGWWRRDARLSSTVNRLFERIPWSSRYPCQNPAATALEATQLPIGRWIPSPPLNNPRSKSWTISMEEHPLGIDSESDEGYTCNFKSYHVVGTADAATQFAIQTFVEHYPQSRILKWTATDRDIRIAYQTRKRPVTHHAASTRASAK